MTQPFRKTCHNLCLFFLISFIRAELHTPIRNWTSSSPRRPQWAVRGPTAAHLGPRSFAFWPVWWAWRKSWCVVWTAESIFNVKRLKLFTRKRRTYSMLEAGCKLWRLQPGRVPGFTDKPSGRTIYLWLRLSGPFCPGTDIVIQVVCIKWIVLLWFCWWCTMAVEQGNATEIKPLRE